MDYLKPQTLGTKEKIQPNTQASLAGRVCKGGSLTRTWTRVARVAQIVEECNTGEVVLSSKRTMMEVDNCEVPKKRKLVAQNNQINSSMVEATR